MKSTTLRRWAWLHTWSSLICTVFMLLLCITGLPLIFHHEIAHLLGTEVEVPARPDDHARAPLDAVVGAARAQHPDRVVQFFFPDEHDPRLMLVTLTPTPQATDDFRSVAVDARDAQVLGQPRFDQGFMWVMFKLHVDLFAGLPGMLFLGAMGLLMVMAIVSGVVLYGPYMKRLPFGTVRRDRSPRLRWLDLHNLLGITTVVWATVVGFTGVVNTWADLLFKAWQHDVLSTLLAPYQGQPPVPPDQLAPLQRSHDAALAAVPGRTLRFAAMPGTAFSSPHHVSYFLKGDTPLTSRLLQPVLVDARTAEVTAVPPVPWYMTALLISQPLHFGDYGGLPMQILWALLDIVTIVVLGSGLYLWWVRRRAARPLAQEAEAELEPDGSAATQPAPALGKQL